ncbi:carbohydrate kinase family protein [Natrialbaceae archaeon A-gly3]
MDQEILIVGETLIDFLPERPGPFEDVSGFDRRPGGAPANVAVSLSRLGITPSFWTRVGDDPFGQYLEGVLAEEGIPERFLERDLDARTTLAFVIHDEAGDRDFTFYREGTADTRLEPGRIDDAVLEDFEWVHAGGVTLSSGRSREATFDLLERAAAHASVVSFDPNDRPELWPDEATFRSVVRDALAHVDVLKATEAELETLGFEGRTPEELARDAIDGGPETVFLTRGSTGAIAVAAGASPWAGVASHPGFDVDVVDTTGAGDAFLAGVIAACLEGRDLEGTLAFANAVAATATTAAGAMAALPDREAVEDVLASGGD